jgi:hypothetical protein
MTHVAEQKSMGPLRIGAVVILTLFTGATMVATVQSVTVTDVLSGTFSMSAMKSPAQHATYDDCRQLASKAAELPESAKAIAQQNVNSCYQAVSDKLRASAPPSFTVQPVVGGCAVNMQNYMRMNEGITYQDAVDIMGCEGREAASGSFARTTTVIYTWQSRIGHGNMSATFQNDRLISRAQAGLR